MLKPQRQSRVAALTVSFLLLVWSTGPLLGGQTPAAPTPPTEQQPDEIVAELRGDQRPRLRLAFPAAVTPVSVSAAQRSAVEELEQTLRDDLAGTGVFDIQGPEVLSVLDLTGDQKVDFELYRSLANEVILLAAIKVTADKIVLEGLISDLKSGRSILGKRYRGELSQARRVAHTLSDEMVRYFSGRRGIALTNIVFVSNRDNNEGNKELYLMDYDGHNQRRISGHRSITLSPSWSPTGDGIAYVSFFGGGPGIYYVDLVQGGKRPLMTTGGHNISPSFSPNGNRFTFSRSVRGNAEIYVASRDGGDNGDLQRLTHSAGIDTNPAWSPNGREIAFTSSRTGSPQIYLMDAEGTNLRRITFEGQYNDGAAWHPDGNKLIYASRSDLRSPFQIVLHDLVTLETRTLTSGRGSHESPAFSPDGRRIVFELNRGGRSQLFVMDGGGGNLRQLTSEGDNSAPSWSSYLK